MANIKKSKEQIILLISINTNSFLQQSVISLAQTCMIYEVSSVYRYEIVERHYHNRNSPTHTNNNIPFIFFHTKDNA